MDKEKIKALVAEKHGIILGDNDPILATIAISEVVLEDMVLANNDAILSTELRIEQAFTAHESRIKKEVRDIILETAFGLKKQLDDHRALLAKDWEAARVAVAPAAEPTISPHFTGKLTHNFNYMAGIFALMVFMLLVAFVCLKSLKSGF